MCGHGLTHRPGDSVGNVRIESFQQSIRPIHQGHVDAQSLKHVAHFQRNKATTHDNHGFGQLRKPHDVFVGVVGDA